MVRSIQDWIEIFNKLPAPNSVEDAIASRIMHDMVGYRAKINPNDVFNLSNALQAYAKLLQDAGVKV